MSALSRAAAATLLPLLLASGFANGQTQPEMTADDAAPVNAPPVIDDPVPEFQLPAPAGQPPVANPANPNPPAPNAPVANPPAVNPPAPNPPAAGPLPIQPAPAAAKAGGDPLVTIDFPEEGIELTLLADIVTKRLNVPILYDEQARGKKVIVRVPSKVPESALMGILQSALRLKQLALVDAEQPGWKQIVPAPNLAAVAQLPGKNGENPGEGPLTQAFLLERADPAKVMELLRPFLTQPGGSVATTAGQKVLLVSDYASVVKRAGELIKQLDAQAPALETKFVPLANAEAGATATALTQLIATRETFQWGSATGSGIGISPDERTNQLIVVAPPARMGEVLSLIAGLDKSPERTTRVYRLTSLDPERVDTLVKGLLDANSLKRSYQASVDRDTQSLAVSATPSVHERIDALVKELDVPAPASANPIQFYKLKNTKAADVLQTISGLVGGDARQAYDGGPDDRRQPFSGPMTAGGVRENLPAGLPLNGDPNAPLRGNAAGAFEAERNLSNGLNTGGFNSSGLNATNRNRTGLGSSNGFGDDGYGSSPRIGGFGDRSASPGVLAVRGKDATVAADVNTNSIVVIGPPPVQQQYADLIKRLDQRRPQVQIECTIVTLDTSDNATFGVDIGKLGGFDSSQLLTLSSFGISSADAETGRLTPVAGRGGTFALLSPGIADVVLRALKNDGNARLVSAPQLLVNDNGVGQLKSKVQQPFAEILNASSDQSVTGLGGRAEAGTEIRIEPHISEADYLQLGYSIELSRFTGDSSGGLPPPSVSNNVESEVTIPDGYTIVVGGLSTSSTSKDRSTIPILGDIPVVGWLFGTRSGSNSNSTLFVFIKPTILRDDKFEDLKYLSGRARSAAAIADDFPASSPVPIR